MEGFIIEGKDERKLKAIIEVKEENINNDGQEPYVKITETEIFRSDDPEKRAEFLYKRITSSIQEFIDNGANYKDIIFRHTVLGSFYNNIAIPNSAVKFVIRDLN